MKGRLSTAWRAYRIRLLKFGVPLAGFIALLSYRLGDLVNGLSASERTQLALGGSWRAIMDNPLGAPLSVGQWILLTAFKSHSPWLLRLPSLVITVIAVISFWYVLRSWYGSRTAAYGTIVFATSAWLLHVGRLGGTAIVFTSAIPVLLALFIVWERQASRYRTHYTMALALAVLTYIPGFIWFILLVGSLQNRQINLAWRKLGTPLQRLTWIGLYLLSLAPLGYAAAKHRDIWLEWLGLPATFGNPGDIPHRLAESVSFLVWRGPLQPDQWLDRLAVLSIFSILMLVLGTIFYVKHIAAPRTRLLVSLFIFSALFYAIGGPVGYGMVVSVAYLIVAAGIGYILHEWLKVFPKNPVARWIGYSVLALVVALSCSYDLRSYFVAWPNSPVTQAAFRDQP